MVCVVRVVGGPFYSSLRSVPAKINMEMFITAFRRIRVIFPPKCTWTGVSPGSDEPRVRPAPLWQLWPPPFSVHCLVGPCVDTSVPGLRWSVWSGLWASFACVTQDAIFCDFVYVFFVFSSYSGLVLLKT